VVYMPSILKKDPAISPSFLTLGNGRGSAFRLASTRKRQSSFPTIATGHDGCRDFLDHHVGEAIGFAMGWPAIYTACTTEGIVTTIERRQKKRNGLPFQMLNGKVAYFLKSWTD